MATVSITPKWQIHIPVSVREKLGLTKPTRADVSVDGDTIIIRPKQSAILSMEGKYKNRKPTKKVDITNIRDCIDYSNL